MSDAYIYRWDSVNLMAAAASIQVDSGSARTAATASRWAEPTRSNASATQLVSGSWAWSFLLLSSL